MMTQQPLTPGTWTTKRTVVSTTMAVRTLSLRDGNMVEGKEKGTSCIISLSGVTVVLYCLLLVQSQITLWDSANSMLPPNPKSTN